MTKADDTTTTAPGAEQSPGPETIRTIAYFAESLSKAVQGAIYTLDLLKSELLREADDMNEGGTAENWASVIGLIAGSLDEPHEDLEKTLRAWRAQMRAVA